MQASSGTSVFSSARLQGHPAEWLPDWRVRWRRGESKHLDRRYLLGHEYSRDSRVMISLNAIEVGDLRKCHGMARFGTAPSRWHEPYRRRIWEKFLKP